MIIDGRIYATAFILLGMASFAICAAGMMATDNDRVQAILWRCIAITLSALALVPMVGMIDWIWA